MKRIRFSIPLLIVIFLIGGFGVVTYFNWENNKKMKETYININQKRIMDKLTSSIKIATNYERLFDDIVKDDEYILELHAFTLDRSAFTEDSKLPEEHEDLFTKTVRSIGSTSPFPTENHNYIYMRVDPNNNENPDDDIIVSARMKKLDDSLFAEYYLLIVNASIGAGVTLLLFILSFIFIGIGFAPLRRLSRRIPYVIHKGGKPFLINKADSEVMRVINEFHRTTEELNEINRMLTELSKTNSKETFVLTLFRFLERKGMKSLIIINKYDDTFKTLTYKGVLEDEDAIKSFSVKEDELLEGQSELFIRILTTKSYVEINNDNKSEFSEVDITIFGSQSVYMPILVNDTVQAVIGGSGKLDNELKKILNIISNRWGAIVYGMIKNTVEKDIKSEKGDKNKTPIEKEEKLNDELETITEYKSRKPIDDEKEKDTQRRKVVEEINKDNEEYIKSYKEALILAKKKDYEGAIQKLMPIADVKDDVKLFKLLGTCYFNVREFESAIEYWEKVLEIKPEDTSITNNIEKARQKLD